MRSLKTCLNEASNMTTRACTRHTTRETKFLLTAMVASALGMASSSVEAALYVNGDVSTGVAGTINISGNQNELNDGGAYALDLTNLGRSSSNVSLKILNASTNTYATTLAMGYTAGGGPGNLLLVDGVGSALVSTGVAVPGAIVGGTNFSGQSMTIQNGGAATFSSGIMVGRRGTASTNVVTVDNGTLTIDPTASTPTSSLFLRIAGDNNTASGSGNSVAVKNDGVFVAGNSTYKVDLTIGFAGSTAVDNNLTLSSGGLFKLANTLSTVTIQPSNYVRFDGGFLAWNGNQTGSLAASVVQVWDGAAYVGGVLNTNYSATFYASNDDALAATGISGLGGYTVFTNIVPEPTSAAILGVAGLTLLRRRRSN